MNYLAHLWLADATGTSPAGAILGDVVHGRVENTVLPDDLAQGIRIHRHVDAVTDRHPLTLRWRHRFPRTERRHAGIVLDLLCDHALAMDWSRYSARPLGRFADDAGYELAAQALWFARYGGWTPNAVSFSALLRSYAQWPGFERAVERTAHRLRRPDALLQAARHGARVLPEIRDELPQLLGDLLQAAREVDDRQSYR
ncbi:MAG TPA: ACP phosphodiesterase [Nevskiaceae bacterium]